MFKVKINSAQTVYCNLTSDGNNTFTGQSTGLTLLSGLYDAVTVDGVMVVYPYLYTSEFTTETITEFIHIHTGTPALDTSVKTVLISPGINNTSPYTYYAQFSDHLVLQQILELESAYRNQLVDSRKLELDKAYHRYVEDPDGTRKLINDNLERRKKAFPDMDPEGWGEPSATEYLIKYLDDYGENNGLVKVSDYLSDKTNRTYWKDFIQNRD